MPKFLSADEIYSVLQRENPPDTYPDGPPTGTFANAELYSTAYVLGKGYTNLNVIYDNYFPQYTNEKISDWENLIFGMPSDSSLTTQARRDRIIAKIRTRRRTTPQDMQNTVYSVVPSSVPVEIREWGCTTGGWILDESELDITTILNGFAGVSFPAVNATGNYCNIGAADLGLSPADYAAYQQQAYTYEVLIYGYTLSTLERQLLDAALNDAEPARSQHIITDGLDPNNQINGDT